MRSILLLLLGICVAYGLNAQRPGDLKGPQAKNAYAFRTVKQIRVVTRSVPIELKGPVAKNYLRQGVSNTVACTNTTKSPRMWMKGPGAKNYQPRIQKSNTNVFRKRTAEE
ncbi:MAG: hypothetical protein IPL46_16065 [Saprospiraceae bacterium]|nr:hypothetical protein [Saprospiraceae bacterium]